MAITFAHKIYTCRSGTLWFITFGIVAVSNFLFLFLYEITTAVYVKANQSCTQMIWRAQSKHCLFLNRECTTIYNLARVASWWSLLLKPEAHCGEILSMTIFQELSYLLFFFCFVFSVFFAQSHLDWDYHSKSGRDFITTTELGQTLNSFLKRWCQYWR